jgi:sugar lactone lactonase YvrE
MQCRRFFGEDRRAIAEAALVAQTRPDQLRVETFLMIRVTTRICTVLLLAATALAQQAQAQTFQAGGPLAATSENGQHVPMSFNVKVYGSYNFAESCTFDPHRNLILAMNAGAPQDQAPNDGYVSLINPDGSVHTTKWIGATRDGLELNHPLGSAVRNGLLYTVDQGVVRTFDLVTGEPRDAFPVPGSTFLNGIGVAEDGTIYASNSRDPESIFRVTADGDVSTFVEGAPLNVPNGVAIDPDGNVVVVNIGDNAVLTFNPNGRLIRTEHAFEGGNDGLVILPDGTKYVSSVRFGSVSRISPGEEAVVVASGIPTAASMCYDSVQHQLVIPMNNHNSLAFVELND